MTKRQAERYRWLCNALERHGFGPQDVDTLLRAERTLHRWAEEECNGTIQRDGENGDGKPRRWYHGPFGEPIKGSIVSDREKSTLARVDKLCKARGVTFYHQQDPRGCSLYIIRPGDIKDGMNVDSCYTNGIACCVD